MQPVATHQPVRPIEMVDVAVGALQPPGGLVVEHVNWSVDAGDFWVIGGLQGAGKSDFLFTTGGLMPPLEGSYRMFGETMPIFEESRLRTRLRLGLVFDSGQLLSRLTASENVALPLMYHRNLSLAQAQPLVQNLLAALDLVPWGESLPGGLGWNWQKRVGLARALSLQPEILLIDDPLAGLDLRHGNWWLGFLEQLSKGHPLMDGRPMTLVVTTSDLRPWQGLARQFAILQAQRLTLLGSWEAVETGKAESVRELMTMKPSRD